MRFFFPYESYLSVRALNRIDKKKLSRELKFFYITARKRKKKKEVEGKNMQIFIDIIFLPSSSFYLGLFTHAITRVSENSI